MDLAFPWPISQGEWLAFWAAVATVVLGLLMMVAPRLALTILAPGAKGNGDAAALARGLPGGLMFGLGAASILLAQPTLYAALAICWGMATLGSVLALFSRSATRVAVAFTLLLSLVLCGLAGCYAFGFIS